MIPEYLDYILQNIRLNKKIKVVIDGGNGTAGLTAGELYRRLGAEVIEIFCEVDGRTVCVVEVAPGRQPTYLRDGKTVESKVRWIAGPNCSDRN